MREDNQLERPMTIVRASSPTRIDLAGGTIDLWPIYSVLDHRATVNCAVTLNATVTVKESEKKGEFTFHSIDQLQTVTGTFDQITNDSRLQLFSLIVKNLWTKDLPALHIESQAKSPAGAGLGGSSCLAITMIGAILKLKNKLLKIKTWPTDHQLVQIAQDIEARIIHTPTGCQDYWGALRGGVNILKFPAGAPDVKTLDAKKIKLMNDRLIICYSGKSRASAINNWEIFKRVFDRDQELLKKLNEIGLLAEQCGEALNDGNIDETLEISKKEWDLRKSLWPNIETHETKALDQAAISAGAMFSRVCGAGGGGVMAVFAPPSKRQRVCDALARAGGSVLEAELSEQGLTFGKD